MDGQLSCKGWFLSEEGLKACKAAIGKEVVTDLDIIKTALKSDLRQIARKVLPENINNGQVESINGPVVLQIQKVRNVSAPLANQDSKGAPRMLKLNLTDGCTHCVGIEFTNISFLNMNIIPGTKVCLSGCGIPISKGCILLGNDNIKLLGGEVEVLKTKWEASKQVARSKRLGKGDDDPPPAFTEFDSSKPRSKRNAEKRNNLLEYVNSEDTTQKQTSTKKSQIKQKVDKDHQERNQDSEVSQKKSNKSNENVCGRIANEGSSNKNEYKSLWNSKKNEHPENNVKSEQRGKGESYKDKKVNEKNWDNNSRSDSATREKDLPDRNEQKGEKKREQNNKKDYHQVQQREKKTPQTSNKGSEKEIKSSQDSRVSEKEKKTQDYRTNGREARTSQDYKANEKEKKTSQEKKPSQDYRMREKKNDWSNEEYDRKIEKKKDEKDLWLDERSREQKEKFHNKKDKNVQSGGYNERDYPSQNKTPSQNREQYANEKGYRDGKNPPSDKRGDLKSETRRSSSESRRSDGHVSRSDQNSQNRSYNDKGRRDKDTQRYADRDTQSQRFERPNNNKYDKGGKEQSKDCGGEKNKCKENNEGYAQDKVETGKDGKKPVAYDASSQNWYYDGEAKVKKDNHQVNDIASIPFKEGKFLKKDDYQVNDIASIPFKEGKFPKKDDHNRSSYRDNGSYRGYHGEARNVHRNDNKEKDYKRNNNDHSNNNNNNNNYRGDTRYESNKKDQKNRNYKGSDKKIPDGPKTNEKDHKANDKNDKKYSRDYSRDSDSDYNYRDRVTSDYNKDDDRLRRQKADQVGAVIPDGSSNTSVSVQGQQNNGNSSNCIDESNLRYSPGKRIPLEVLFGKNMKISNDCDNKSATMTSNLNDNTANNIQTTNVAMHDQRTNSRPKRPYSKASSREIMERSLEQKSFSEVPQGDYVYMPYAAVNQAMGPQLNQQQQQQQLNQQVQYPYQQTLQPVSTIQVSTAAAASQYIGYTNEHSAALAATVNPPYLSYHNPPANYQYNQIHTQQQQHATQQTQNVASDVPYYPNNAQYYYQINNPITQLPEQYQ